MNEQSRSESWLFLGAASITCIAVGGVLKWLERRGNITMKRNPCCYKDYSKLQHDLSCSDTGVLQDIVIEGKIKPEENTASSGKSVSNKGPVGLIANMGKVRMNPNSKESLGNAAFGPITMQIMAIYDTAISEANEMIPKPFFSVPFILEDETTNNTIKVREIDISHGFRSFRSDIVTSTEQCTLPMQSNDHVHYIQSGIQYEMLLYGSMAAILGDAKRSLKEDIVCEFIPKEVAKSAESFTTKSNNIAFTVLIITGALLAIAALIFWKKERDNENQADEIGNQPEQDQQKGNENQASALGNQPEQQDQQRGNENQAGVVGNQPEQDQQKGNENQASALGNQPEQQDQPPDDNDGA